jgi:choloylglycine hydrolase
MCTDFLLSTDKSTVYVNGRSMEFGIDLKSQLRVVPAGTEFESLAPDEKRGLKWTSVYDYLGLNGRNAPVLSDGMNLKGLSVGALWLPGTAYPGATDTSCALSVGDIVGYLLGMFATVDEVKEALKATNPTRTGNAVQVWAPEGLADDVPLHFAVHDAQGKSLVVEFLDHEIQVTDNPVGVLTNYPPFPDQLANLGSYAGLTANDATFVEMGGQRFHPAGHGSGMMGLPGDSTPPSRFVRAAYLKHFATPVTSATAACNLAFHILNDVDIPMGTSRSKSTTGEQSDYTQWVVVKDLTNKVLYTRFYDNMMVYSVDLKALKFPAKPQTFPVPGTPPSTDITSTLKV